MPEMWLVEYKLHGLDVIPVSLEHEGREKAISEGTRLLAYHDLVYLKIERL